MPAPDLPPPPEHVVHDRPLHVYLHAKLVTPERLEGGVVIVIDALRASVTIATALHAGAPFVVPCLTVEDAHNAARALSPAPVLLGGERGGVLVPGFDLDNSPASYTTERIAGRPVVFTTTNGTAALLHARGAALVLVGSFANLSAVCASVRDDPRPVHILCCGTRDEISMDDCLPAGAMVQRLTAAGRRLTSDDSGRLCMFAYFGASTSPTRLVDAMRASRGGRNLSNIGLDGDVDLCATLDTLAVVPRFDASLGRIVRHDLG
jgi:2-phosphosulfolactate phosphatase